MVISSVATGILGLLQELTYKTYGPCWKEGVLYTVYAPWNVSSLLLTRFNNQHFLSLPIFVFLFDDIKLGIYKLSSANTDTPSAIPFIILLCNIVTQLICVSGVNKLNAVCFQSLCKQLVLFMVH